MRGVPLAGVGYAAQTALYLNLHMVIVLLHDGHTELLWERTDVD